MAASPSETELVAKLQNAVRVLDNYLSQQTLLDDIDTLEQSLEGDRNNSITSAAAAIQSAGEGVIARGKALLDPIFEEFAIHLVQAPAATPEAAVQRLFRWMVDNAKSVKSRAPTYGPVVPDGGNTGDGTVRRLTVDEDAFAIEASHADVKVFKVVADENTGANQYEEVFEVRGVPRRSVLDLANASTKGSGIVLLNPDVSRARSSRDSLFRNSGFDQKSIAGTVASGSPYTLVAGDSLPSWTINSGLTNITLDADSLYESPRGVALPLKMRWAGNVNMSQTFQDANVNLDLSVPLDWGIALRRIGSGDGTFTHTVGSNATATVDITTLANNVWTPLYPTLDQNLWPVNFSSPDAALTLSLTGNTTGSLEIDAMRVVPLFGFDGLWYNVWGGETRFAIDDSLSFTDTIPSDSKVQKWVWLVYGNLYLPHSGTPTWADPT